MSKKEENTYRSARRAFDDLEVDEKARFMVEAVMSTVAEGIDRLSRVIADGFESMASDPTDEGESTADRAARPPKKAKSKSKSSGSGSKKQSARKSGTSAPDAA